MASQTSQWPMIILRSPKGWTGPKEVDGKKAEGLLAIAPSAFCGDGRKPEHVLLLEEWMKSYKPEEAFNENGKLIDELAELA